MSNYIDVGHYMMDSFGRDMIRKSRDSWIDNVKVFACIFVVLGHFYQSMVKADLINSSTFYYCFINTIYLFHVQLFFICSGFLYQKYSCIDSLSSWKMNITKKIITIGIPYFVFSVLTWLLKTIFSSSVNMKIGGIIDTLFARPVSPYWFLYILFIIFAFTLTTKNEKRQWMLFGVSVAVKLLQEIGLLAGLKTPYFINKTIENWIWFVFGMLLSYGTLKFVNTVFSIICFAIFLFIRIITLYLSCDFGVLSLCLSFVACYSIIGFFYSICNNTGHIKYWQLAVKYTMPVFLMHTLFAATCRSILIKYGIKSVGVHIILGIIVTFCGPILAMRIFEKLKPLDFLVYPMRYLKINNSTVQCVDKNSDFG